MPSQEIRKRFLEFFAKRGHAIIPSASLVPEGDASTLFTTAGMQPLAPYLLGALHPKGKRVVNIQKCVRTGDIDDVGDNRHLTFFEMLGNWSFGDYFKKEAIAWSYELLTSKDEGFGLDSQRLYVTCFEGNDDAPQDTESFETWKDAGVSEEHIFFLGADDNWWSPGDNGPSGPDTEMFYDLKPEQGEIVGHDAFVRATNTGRVVEIWNDVFMEYERRDGKVIEKLVQQNVDTGAGLERLATVLQGKQNVFETDLFAPLMEVTPKGDEQKQRIIADHIKAAVFMIADGVTPSNTDRGYVVRRLIRRAATKAFSLDSDYGSKNFNVLAQVVMDLYPVYMNKSQQEAVKEVISLEIRKFRATIEKGLMEEKKGTDPFVLFTTYGIPFEVTQELARERGEERNEMEFREKMKKHQEVSRAGAEQKFKGGLADADSPEVVRLHTATHLLNQALYDVLGEHVSQKGSNITPERLRYDFSHPQKMTDEERKRVEEIVNEKIKDSMPVHQVMLSRDEAEATGARHAFNEKYGDTISIYYIGDSLEGAYSKEFCGGPHVHNTSELGYFKIIKEEAVSSGVRRIKAVLE
ncbi:MAG: alanine--tRNA ligase [Candidatus Campbellbacteria bacterium]|nr:alanine--tRNA ligase [Candidatus Campbellbacteria bacterium]